MAKCVICRNDYSLEYFPLKANGRDHFKACADCMGVSSSSLGIAPKDVRKRRKKTRRRRFFRKYLKPAPDGRPWDLALVKTTVRDSDLRYYTPTKAKVMRPQYLKKFGDRCLICGREDDRPSSPITGLKQGRDVLVLDHDHKTEEVRGVICTTCNAGLGMFRDSPELLFKASMYLVKKPEWTENIILMR